MRTTDDILKDLRARAAAGEDVRQQIISHETVARLRPELAGVEPGSDPERERGLAQQIRLHLGLVDEDVTVDADKPARGKSAAK